MTCNSRYQISANSTISEYLEYELRARKSVKQPSLIVIWKWKWLESDSQDGLWGLKQMLWKLWGRGSPQTPRISSSFPRPVMLHQYLWKWMREERKERSGRQVSWRKSEPQGVWESFCQVVALRDLTTYMLKTLEADSSPNRPVVLKLWVNGHPFLAQDRTEKQSLEQCDSWVYAKGFWEILRKVLQTSQL